jgi:hypothetical protein
MSVQDCLFQLSEKLPKLFGVSEELQLKKIAKDNPRFDWKAFDDDIWKSTLKPIINSIIDSKEARNLMDPGHRACKT